MNHELIGYVAHVVMIVASLGAVLYGVRLLGLFKGGLLEPSFRVLALAPILMAAVGVADITSFLMSDGELLKEAVHPLLEAVFIVLLLTGYKKMADKLRELGEGA